MADCRFRKVYFFLIVLAAFSAARPSMAQEAWLDRVDPWVLETASRSGETEFLVFLAEQANLSEARLLGSKDAKGWYVHQTLFELAERTQEPIRKVLEDAGVSYRPYWVANMIWVRGDRSIIEAMARRPDVARVSANPSVAMEFPMPQTRSRGLAPFPDAEPNITHTGVPDVFWSAGVFGQGAVIGGADTGYDWDHPALSGSYRGNESVVDHNYNWHDAIHSGGGVCGPDSPEPCDDHGHGTHTMGTMAGFDGGTNWVGMAPAAKWIGCRNMNQGVGTPTSYSECFQWFLAPTDSSGLNPDPSQAPHVINNSWSCPVSEGCTDPNVLLTVVQNVRAAGILIAVSAGNSGPGCSTVSTPAAIYGESFSVGATDNSDVIASFSSRGPVTVDGSNRLKPDISAPGVSVRSASVGGGYSFLSGTSMAAPHVAGMVGLLVSAASCWAGDVDQLEQHMVDWAQGLTTTQTCGSLPGSEIPNHTYGYGGLRSQLPGVSCPDVVTLSSEPWVQGQIVELAVTGAQAGEKVWFYASFVGPGLGRCISKIDVCLDIRDRARLLGQGVADVGGTATVSFNVPGALADRNVYLQALTRGGVKSNLLVARPGS